MLIPVIHVTAKFEKTIANYAGDGQVQNKDWKITCLREMVKTIALRQDHHSEKRQVVSLCAPLPLP